MKKFTLTLLLVLLSLPLLSHAGLYLADGNGSQTGDTNNNPYSTRIIITPLEGSPTPFLSATPTPIQQNLNDSKDELNLDLPDLKTDSNTQTSGDLSLDEFNTSDDLLNDAAQLPNNDGNLATPSATPVALPPPRITIPDALDFVGPTVVPTVTSNSDLGIRLKKSDDKNDTVLRGETLGFSAEVTNKGPETAHNVIAEIYYGQNDILNMIDIPTACLDDKKKLVCLIDSIAPGNTSAVTFTGKVLDNVKDGANFVNAGVFYQGVDENVTDNSGSLRLDIGKPLASMHTDLIQPLKKVLAMSKDIFFENAYAAGKDTVQVSNSTNLLAGGFIMPVFAIDESPEKVIVPDIAVNPKVAQPDENLIFILTIANNSQTQYSKVHATVFYPFDYLDLVTASEPYSYNQADEAVEFSKDTLNPGERWLIRINGKVKNAATVIPDKSPRTIVNSFTITAEQPQLSDDFASTQVLIVTQKEKLESSSTPGASPQTASASPAQTAPAISPAPSKKAKAVMGPIKNLPGSGPDQALTLTLTLSVLSGFFLTIRHYRNQYR